MLTLLPSWLVWTCFFTGFLALATYIIPVVYQWFLPDQNLKEKYGARWALVTGSSSGIGKAIAERLAEQGINVVIVALPDALLDATFEELKSKFPAVEFRKVGVNLGATDPEEYLKPIRDATLDISVRLVFNNAGYILPGIFHCRPMSAHMTNLNCNATSSVAITHHFLERLLALPAAPNGKRGLISFTSSSAGFLPTPISSLYGATKSFLTSFASAIATEVQEDGIDVVVVHPSPIASRFYERAQGINLLTAFQKTALSPRVIADTIFKAAGKCIVRDQGYFSIGTKLMLKAIDWNFMGELAPVFMKNNADFRKLKSAKRTSSVQKEE